MLRGLATAFLLFNLAGGAQAACRQALALALDVSGSVDLHEYRLQLDGLVTALNDPEVRAILLSQPQAPVALLVFEWSGPGDQAVLVPWTTVDGPAALKAISTTLASAERRVTTPGTALGEAMTAGAAHLAGAPDCWKRTLDISGDGKSNLGPRPRDVKPDVTAEGVTVNGLVVGSDNAGRDVTAELTAYFRAEVIIGPEAFVETALGYEDYAQAMARKLKRELEGRLLSGLDPSGRRP
ncbi:DUF1194 domain-containing protein [Sulfitobacter sp. LCG007]